MKTRTRKTTRVLCASAIAMMTLLSSAAPAFAVNSDAAKSVAPAEPAFSFSKYLLLKKNANVPQASFTFTAESNNDEAGTEVNGYTVFKGSEAGMPTIGNANFTSGQDTFDEKKGTDEVSLTSGYKYAKSTVNVTFENASFTRPGIYRYTIKENKGAKYFDSDTSPKYLDVYKYNDGTFTYIMHSTNTLFTTADKANKDTKITSISNTYKTQDLKVKKEVDGNQAVNDDFFKFTVNISGLIPGEKINATGLNEEQNETREWKVNEKGEVNAEVYLSANSGVATFNGLTDGATYTVTEEAKNYTQESAKVDAEEATFDSLNKARKITGDDDTVVFTNKKDGTIPTGIYLNHKLPFNIAGIAILGGAISLVAKKRHDALEEDDDE